MTKARPDNEEQRRGIILSQLKYLYPQAHIALKYSTPWELLVAVILSAQCTDSMVNKVTAALFQKYKTIHNYAAADREEFEQDIKSTGFFRNKAKHILETANIIETQYGGVVPDTMETLLRLPGVARKTANVILGNAFGIVEGIAVDTHVSRISQRFRLVPFEAIGGKQKMVFRKGTTDVIDYIKDADPVKIERVLMGNINKEEWFSFTYMIIDHGRAICKAQNPRCSVCPLRSICPSSRV